MGKKYLVGPFLCAFAAWTVGNGTVALLPLYAIERGASAAGSGLFLAFAFGCLALGTFAPGLLSKRFAHRRMLAGRKRHPVGAPVPVDQPDHYPAGLSRPPAEPPISLPGSCSARQRSLPGLAAPEQERGTAFGILGMTNGLGALVGGLGAGWLADRFGFAGVFWEAAAVAAC